MTPFRRVLVGIGGSERHGDALALAQRLVDHDGGELILAHVDGDRSFRLLPPHASADAAALLAAARGDVRGGVAVRETSRSAPSVARGLTELAEEAGADLLVVGGRPDTSGHVAPGRIGMRLVSGAPCAVALAPAGPRDAGAFRHLGIAYDGSAEAAAALASGYALAVRDRAAVSIFYAITARGLAWTGHDPDEMERGLRAERLRAHELLDAAADAAPAGVNPRTVLLFGDPVRRITAACDGIVDIVFAGSGGHGPVHRALAGSFSEALLLAATQPYVVMPRSGAPRAAAVTPDGSVAAP
jgi:nucleotide-binding universal stress UspA family protein